MSTSITRSTRAAPGLRGTGRRGSLLAAALLAALSACDWDGTGPRRPGPPAALEVVDGNGQQGTAGQPLPQPVRVRLEDARGRPIPNHAVTFVVTSGGGSVATPTSTTDADGVAATQWTLGTSVSAAQALEARVTGSDGVVLTAPFTATIGPATAARLVAMPLAHNGVAGSPLPDSLAVQALDQFGNPVPGVTITWTVTGGGGSISPATSTTGATGVARAQWTLGTANAATHAAQASAPGVTPVSFHALAAFGMDVVQGNGLTVGAGMPVNVMVALGNANSLIPNVRVEWTVLSGGGTVSPATSVTASSGGNYGLASTTWTLGPAGGTQTLRAKAGNLERIITVTAIPQGTRALLAQVPGRVLDASGDRVLWLDSAGGPRLIKVRTLSSGADVTIKVDSAANSPLPLAGHLFTGGALVWANGNVFEYRGGTLSHLGPYVDRVATDGNWAAWNTGSSVVRRDLGSGTNTTVRNSAAGSVNVGADGDVVYIADGGPFLYSGGSTASISTEGIGSVAWVDTDGVNVVYIVVAAASSSATLYLDRPGGDEVLTAHSSKSGGQIFYDMNGGWIGFNTPLTPPARRSPSGQVQTLTEGTIALRTEAIAPDGTVVYYKRNDAGALEYFLVTPAGVTYSLGPADPAWRIHWHVDRFILITGSAAYQLSA